jgi:predicted DNA-binding transcriptional regulator AlpA
LKRRGAEGVALCEQPGDINIMQTKYTSKHLESMFQRSRMTIDRWTDDPTLGFPQPVRVRRRKLWSAVEVDQWWERQRTKARA